MENQQCDSFNQIFGLNDLATTTVDWNNSLICRWWINEDLLYAAMINPTQLVYSTHRESLCGMNMILINYSHSTSYTLCIIFELATTLV